MRVEIRKSPGGNAEKKGAEGVRKKRFLALVAALLLLLPGCSERVASNSRIYALARREAGRLAEAYILEKYGVEAQALGYDVDGSEVIMSWSAVPVVTVAMTDGEREFLAYLGLEDSALRWDNYQSEEVAACLEGYLLEQLGLAAGEVSELEFRCRGDKSPGQAQINGETWLVSNMLDFRYEGQPAGELLEKMTTVQYEGRWVGDMVALAEVKAPEGWPGEVSLRLLLKEYRDRESYAAYKSVYLAPGGREVSVRESPALTEHVFLSLDEGETERQYAAYDRYDEGDLAFVGRVILRGEGTEGLPAPGWVAGQVSYPQVPLLWPEKEGRPCGPLFCCTRPEGPEGVEYDISCTVLPAFFEAHGEELFYGVYEPLTGEQRVYTSLPLRPGQPGTYGPGNVYIRQSLWVGSRAEKPYYYTFLGNVL